jgi:hypothetical protein
MTLDQERTYLQRTVAVAGLVPVAAGLFGVLLGTSLTGDRTSISADSHFRYLSGLLLGIGILFWSTLPRIGQKSTLFRHLCLVVVLGGLARLLGLVLTGVPSIAMMGGLFMELVVTPALCLWQIRVANRHEEQASAPLAPVSPVPPAM